MSCYRPGEIHSCHNMGEELGGSVEFCGSSVLYTCVVEGELGHFIGGNAGSCSSPPVESTPCLTLVQYYTSMVALCTLPASWTDGTCAGHQCENTCVSTGSFTHSPLKSDPLIALVFGRQ